MTEKELQKREWLKQNKPRAFEKIIKNDEINPIIQLQFSYRCNFLCEHCSVHTIQQQNKNRPTMSIDDLKELSRQADEFGVARFEINGGEPLVNKNLKEIIKAIDPKKYYMNLVTNAWLLDEQMAKNLKEWGIDRIQVGFDSLEEKEHDDFRNMKGSYQRTMKAIDHCLNNGIDVFTTTVVTKERLYSDEFIEFIEHFNSKGMVVFCTFAKPVGNWEGHFESLVDEEDLKYFEKLEKKYNVISHLTPGFNRERGCRAFKGLVAINPFGDVTACQYFFVSMGNVLKEPFKDIIERGLKLKPFHTTVCPIANDKKFIDKYIVPTYGKNLPMDWKEIFTAEDFEK